MSNQFPGREFDATVNEQFPLECQVATLFNAEVAAFLQQAEKFPSSNMPPSPIKGIVST